MKEVVLSKINLIYGSVDLPKGFEINRNKIKTDIITSYLDEKRINNNSQAYSYKDYKVPFSKPLQWLQDYLRDNIKTDYGFNLIPKNIFGNVIEYDDNRRKNRTWHLPIANNEFIMFPSTQKYMFTENKSKKLNTILTINYEFI